MIKNLMILTISLIDTFLLLFFVEKNADKEQRTNNDREPRSPIEKYYFIISILVLIIALILMLYVIWISKNVVLSIILGISGFATSMSLNSNEYKDFALINNVFYMKRDTQIKANTLLKINSIIGYIYLLWVTHLGYRMNIDLGAESVQQIMNISVDLFRNLILSFLVISFIIIIVYFVTDNSKISAFKDASIDLYHRVTRYLPSINYINKKYKKGEPVSVVKVIGLFCVPDILLKMLSFILTQISYIIIFVYKILCFIRFIITKVFYIKIDKQNRTFGTVNSLWLILSWGVICALCLSYIDILFYNSYSTRVAQLFTFAISVIIIPMIVSSIISIKKDDT